MIRMIYQRLCWLLAAQVIDTIYSMRKSLHLKAEITVHRYYYNFSGEDFHEHPSCSQQHADTAVTEKGMIEMKKKSLGCLHIVIDI